MSELLDLDFSHYFEEAAPAAPVPEEACVISLFGDSERAILYAGLNESGGALRARAAGSNIEESIALVNVRFVRFERLVDIRVREDHFFGLDVRFAQRHAGRAAVDDTADGRAMAFAEIGDAEQFAEGAAGHGQECQTG